MTIPSWLTIRRGASPLIVSIPHTGTDIPAEIESRLASPWLARKDTDWWIERLYDFAHDLDATIIHTSISRTVIDVNRDPSGASLYPGQATTELCPTTSFDGEKLYRPGREPSLDDIAERRKLFFEPYHAAIEVEIGRLKREYERVILYDCHSIRSVVPRLFEGTLPHLNIGTNGGTSCDPTLQRIIAEACVTSGFSSVVNGRFKGGWITRRHGQPGNGIHAVQMEIACRGYMTEPRLVDPDNWPGSFDPQQASPMRAFLSDLLTSVLTWTRS
ncbi:N-formylglutamate deformylase [Microvirga sp. 2MCAF38]|uniref:N-formylglutamate deformylase n=1 Tax=Microvirga sp. 2MCAF38 TaxID=3232989 RepID=UPI003F9DCB96